MKVFLIRHGESIANAKGVPQGQTIDVGLSKKGKRQSNALARRLKNEGIKYIFSSNLVRAQETAEIIGKKLNIRVNYDTRLKEKDYAKETKNKHIRGCNTFLNDILKLKRNVLIVSHGGTNRRLLKILFRKTSEINKIGTCWQGNCCLNIIKVQSGNRSLENLNNLDHLWADKKLIAIFNNTLVTPMDPRYINKKNNLLYKKLSKENYEVSKKDILFDWKKLPISKEIISILEKNTHSIHTVVLVRVHGAKLILDACWDLGLEKVKFPVTSKWSGLEDTKLISGEKIIFYDKRNIKRNQYFENRLKSWLNSQRKI